MEESFFLTKFSQQLRLLSAKMNSFKVSNDSTGSPVATDLDPALIDRSHLVMEKINTHDKISNEFSTYSPKD